MKQKIWGAVVVVAAGLAMGCANPFAPAVVEVGVSGGPSDGDRSCSELVARALDLSGPVCSSDACEAAYPAGTPVSLYHTEEFRSSRWSVTNVLLRIGTESFRSISDSGNNQSPDNLSFALSPRPRGISQPFTRARVYVHWNHYPDGPGQPRTSIRWAEGSRIYVAQSVSSGPETLTLSAYVDYEIPHCAS